MKTAPEILQEAIDIVTGQREQDYGKAERNLAIISDLWSVYLNHEVRPHDVAAMMALLKIARIRHGGGTGDCWVDLAGYAAIGGEAAGNG